MRKGIGNRFNGFHFGWAQNFYVVSNFAKQTVKTVPWFVDLLLLTGLMLGVNESDF